MRQNLTNVKEIDIKDVEHFYVVGSTTKEGLIEGKSNVKVDLKSAISSGDSGGGEDSSNNFNGDYFFPAKHPFIAMIDGTALDDIFDIYDWDNPQNNPVYTIDTPILKTVDDVDSYMSTLYTGVWPMNHNFTALYDIDELAGKDDSEPRLVSYQAYKEDADTKATFQGPYFGTLPLKLNINGKTFVTFIIGG